MIATLQEKLKNKIYVVFDFDRTLAKMEIDWSDWHTGIAKVYSRFDQNHGYEYGKNPHTYHNKLVKQFGDSLLQEIRAFNQDYEATYLTGFTPNTEFVDFVKTTKPTPSMYTHPIQDKLSCEDLTNWE